MRVHEGGRDISGRLACLNTLCLCVCVHACVLPAFRKLKSFRFIFVFSDLCSCGVVCGLILESLNLVVDSRAF